MPSFNQLFIMNTKKLENTINYNFARVCMNETYVCVQTVVTHFARNNNKNYVLPPFTLYNINIIKKKIIHTSQAL